MTTTDEGLDDMVSGDRELSAAEVEAFQRSSLFVDPDEASPRDFPRMYNISAGFMYRRIVRPEHAQPPDYATVALNRTGDEALELALVVHNWNSLWETAQFRRRFFDDAKLPSEVGAVAELGDINVQLIPRTPSKYFELAPLLHLLPPKVLTRFGLPFVRAGQWPYGMDLHNADRYLPADLAERVARAWAWAVWPHLNSGSPLKAFSGNDPIRILAHNLDFWLPAVTNVIQSVLQEFPEGGDAEPWDGPVLLADGSVFEGVVAGSPRMGGEVWCGEMQAAEVLARTVEAADATGQLRGIIDAVNSNRVEDDFSDRWSFAREDFERKMYRKRSKVGVRFVELTDTVPVQSPESEVLGRVVTSDFLALLDEKHRQIVVMLCSGYRQHEIAEAMGYANHSAIAKRLGQIRRQAEQYFGLA